MNSEPLEICPICEAQDASIPPGFHWDGGYTWDGQPCYRSFDECPWESSGGLEYLPTDGKEVANRTMTESLRTWWRERRIRRLVKRLGFGPWPLFKRKTRERYGHWWSS